MPTKLKSLLWFLACAILLFSSAGCGSSMVKVRGKVVKNGVPREPGRGERLKVIFAPVAEGADAADAFSARVTAGGLFEATGRNGKGIPAGKYRITVNSGDAEALQKSPIVREISSSSDELIIDIAKPDG